jgi:beta-galactosidase
MNYTTKHLRTILLIATFFFAFKLQSQGIKPESFEIKEGNFVYNDKPIKIYSGEMHYSRIPKEYWRNRLKMVKAMGLNTVATYVFWNYHNTSPGIWDFKTRNRNLAEYIRIAQEEGLFVILRPGPYVCAEWEFGGYPWWLQQNKDLVVRTNNQAFIDSCKVYLSKLAEQVKDLQITNGGPIILVQVENEFGSYVSQRTDIPLSEHRAYYNSIHQMLTEVGFNVPFFTSDGTWLFDGGAIDGVLPTANGEGNIENLKKSVNKYYPGGPYMVAEYYPGWLDHWGEEFIRITPEENIKQVYTYLENGVNFNFYMVHGGTNFGFTSGANYNNDSDIQPDLTS